MSRGFRNGDFAVGLVVGICGTLIFILFGEQIYELVNCISQTQCDKHTTPDEHQKEPNWWYWTRRIVAAEDTLAQWVMALFSIAAVALIWRTLAQTNKTNEFAVKTSQAAIAANKIMMDAQRPWLVLERELGCEFSFDGKSSILKWNNKILNWGPAPAFSVRTQSKVISCDTFKYGNQLDTFIETAIERAENVQTLVSIFPNENPEFNQNTNRTRLEEMKDAFFIFHIISYRLWNTEESERGFDVRVYQIVENDGRDESVTDSHLLLEHRHNRQTT